MQRAQFCSRHIVVRVSNYGCHRKRLFCSDSIQGNNTKTNSYHDILSEKNKIRIQNNKPGSDRALGKITVEHRKNESQAAVLVPMCEVNGTPSILFTLRSRKLLKHRGEVSFPGGRYDESDSNLLHTALRETEEELGVSRSKVDVWVKLPPFAQTNRVEETFSVPIAHLCDPANIRVTLYRGQRTNYSLPVYMCAHTVWGLTAAILHLVLIAVAPQHYRFTLDRFPARYSHTV